MIVKRNGKEVIIECDSEDLAKQVEVGVSQAFGNMGPKRMAMAGKLFSKRFK